MAGLVAWLLEVLGLNRPRPLTNIEVEHEPSADSI